MTAKKLYRSKKNKVLFGVCGGLAEYFDTDVTIIRALAIVSIFFGLLGVALYLVLTIITPSH
ncbi:MAG: PspC domain-containing protein [Dehalococcoidales bacterium]|nr:PspC domain-containing protein [Dehalococcoidales bacterium]